MKWITYEYQIAGASFYSFAKSKKKKKKKPVSDIGLNHVSEEVQHTRLGHTTFIRNKTSKQLIVPCSILTEWATCAGKTDDGRLWGLSLSMSQHRKGRWCLDKLHFLYTIHTHIYVYTQCVRLITLHALRVFPFEYSSLTPFLSFFFLFSVWPLYIRMPTCFPPCFAYAPPLQSCYPDTLLINLDYVAKELIAWKILFLLRKAPLLTAV